MTDTHYVFSLGPHNVIEAINDKVKNKKTNKQINKQKQEINNI